MRHEHHDEPYVVIEKHSSGIGTLLMGVAIGAGVALLFAPASGTATRRDLRRRARQATDAVKGVAEDVTGQVTDTFDHARARVEEQIDSARNAIDRKRWQVSRAMEVGREAAEEARGDLERRLEETKAAYRAGARVAHERPAATTATAVPLPDAAV